MGDISKSERFDRKLCWNINKITRLVTWQSLIAFYWNLEETTLDVL